MTPNPTDHGKVLAAIGTTLSVFSVCFLAGYAVHGLFALFVK